MRRAFLSVGLLLVCAPGAVATEMLTESDFLEPLLDDHPSLVTLRGDLGALEAERMRVAALDNPRIDFEREAPEELDEELTLAVSWTPPLDGRRGPAVRAAEAAVDAARADYVMQELRLRSELREIYTAWWLADERSRLMTAQLAQLEELAERMETRAQRGEESGLESRRVTLAAAEADARLAMVDAERLTAQAAVRAWRSDLPPQIRPVRPALPPVSAKPEPAERADVLARAHEVERAEQLATAGGRFLRFPELLFGWRRVNGESASWDGPVIGVSWPLPLFDRQQGERFAASQELARARAQQQLTTRRARAEVDGAAGSYERLREAAIEIVRAVEGAEATAEGMGVAYRLGEASLTDFLETLRSVLEARLTELQTYSAALRAHRTLEVAAGRPIESGGER